MPDDTVDVHEHDDPRPRYEALRRFRAREQAREEDLLARLAQIRHPKED